MKKKSSLRHEEYIIESMKDPEYRVHYLNELMQDKTEGAQERLLVGLRRMAQAYGMGKLSKKIGRGRETLYTTLSPQGNPTLSTFLSILEVFGIQPSFTLANAPKKPKKNAGARSSKVA